MSRSLRILLMAIATSAVAFTAWACEIRVRDSAFRTTRDIHRLCVIALSDDQQANELHDRLQTWLATFQGELNLQVMRVNADDPHVDWRTLGIPSAPPSLPVTVLVGRDNGIGESFLIDYWEVEPDAAALTTVAESPLRSELANKLAKNVAVLLYAPAASSVPESVKQFVENGLPEERIGVELMMVDRNDPTERLLSRFMGLSPGSPDTLCIAFGRGKLMAPPLKGQDITTENIEKLITEIRQACSCSRPLPTMGVDVPLIWSQEIDTSVVLMDQELDLETLADEVESMLAIKEEKEQVGEPRTLEIPAGSQPPLLSEGVDEETNQESLASSSVAKPITLIAVLAAAILLSFAGWRGMKLRT